MAEDGGGGPGPPSEPPSFADFDFNEEDLGVGMEDEMEDVSETVSRSAYDDDGQGSVLSDLASSDMGEEPTPPTRTAAQERAERAYIVSLGGHLRYTCLGCRKSRTKCDRRFPCSRCQAKGCSCVLSSKERADMVLARMRGTFVYDDDEKSVASVRSAFPRGDGDDESRAGTVFSEDGRTRESSLASEADLYSQPHPLQWRHPHPHPMPLIAVADADPLAPAAPMLGLEPLALPPQIGGPGAVLLPPAVAPPAPPLIPEPPPKRGRGRPRKSESGGQKAKPAQRRQTSTRQRKPKAEAAAAGAAAPASASTAASAAAASTATAGAEGRGGDDTAGTKLLPGQKPSPIQPLDPLPHVLAQAPPPLIRPAPRGQQQQEEDEAAAAAPPAAAQAYAREEGDAFIDQLISGRPVADIEAGVAARSARQAAAATQTALQAVASPGTLMPPPAPRGGKQPTPMVQHQQQQQQPGASKKRPRARRMGCGQEAADMGLIPPPLVIQPPGQGLPPPDEQHAAAQLSPPLLPNLNASLPTPAVFNPETRPPSAAAHPIPRSVAARPIARPAAAPAPGCPPTPSARFEPPSSSSTTAGMTAPQRPRVLPAPPPPPPRGMRIVGGQAPPPEYDYDAPMMDSPPRRREAPPPPPQEEEEEEEEEPAAAAAPPPQPPAPPAPAATAGEPYARPPPLHLPNPRFPVTAEERQRWAPTPMSPPPMPPSRQAEFRVPPSPMLRQEATPAVAAAAVGGRAASPPMQPEQQQQQQQQQQPEQETAAAAPPPPRAASPSASVAAAAAAAGADGTEEFEVQPDGGPPSWAMEAPLGPAPGLQMFSHCREAARAMAETAGRLLRSGELQHRKACAIMRSWDLFSYYQGVDASCGAANHLSRVLVTLTCGLPRPPRLCEQEGVPVDNQLLTRPLDQALDPTCLPQYIKLLHDDRAAAVAGFVYANGHFRVWCGREFARRFFSAEQANARLAEARVLPAFLLGDVLHPKDRLGFYEKLAQHMFTRSDEAREVFSVADTLERSGNVQFCILRARYLVLNEGQYACMALHLHPVSDPVMAAALSAAKAGSGSASSTAPPTPSPAPRAAGSAAGSASGGSSDGRASSYDSMGGGRSSSSSSSSLSGRVSHGSSWSGSSNSASSSSMTAAPKRRRIGEAEEAGEEGQHQQQQDDRRADGGATAREAPSYHSTTPSSLAPGPPRPPAPVVAATGGGGRSKGRRIGEPDDATTSSSSSSGGWQQILQH